MYGAAVVIATYNEADNIRQVLEGLRDYVVVVVDDSSPDGTGWIAREYGHVRVISRTGKLGVASAYLCGFRYALEQCKPRYVVQMDAGLTHQPGDVPLLIATARAAPDLLAIGSRFIYLLERITARTVTSLLAAWAMRFLGVPVSDATCGFRCWPAQVLAQVLERPIRARGHAWQMEMLYHAWQINGGRVGEVPIDYRLTGSSFRSWMLWEAMRTFIRLLWYNVRAGAG